MPRVHHPVLGVTRTVAPQQVPIFERSGWQLVEPLAPVASDPADESSTPDVGEPDPLPEED